MDGPPWTPSPWALLSVRSTNKSLYSHPISDIELDYGTHMIHIRTKKKKDLKLKVHMLSFLKGEVKSLLCSRRRKCYFLKCDAD